ncbi:hypothetical protein [Microvirga pakistanensis]|uniref:hypothetical protein n=1 Tax=Microvirga pakistanensis TaxID=1682650 RepID=UPI00141AE11C|nr:hypothetical protein [Microvirga pakistanensis]
MNKGLREGIARAEHHGLLDQPKALCRSFCVLRPDGRQRPHHAVICVDVIGSLALCPFDFTQRNRRLDGSDNGFRYAVLKIEKVGKLAVVPLGPEMAGGGGINQMGDDAKPTACSPNAAFQHIADAKIVADLADIHGLAFVVKVELWAITNSDRKRESAAMIS